MSDPRIDFSVVDEHIAVITISRPEKLNAIDPDMNHALYESWLRFEGDDQLRVAVLASAGGRSFSTGNDLAALSQGRVPAEQFGGNTRDMPLSKPTIAAMHGLVVAGGLEMALACDIRICAEDTRISMPEAKRGLIAGAGGTQRLREIVGLGVTLDMLLTGREIDAESALRWGLVTQVVAGDALLETALDLARIVAESGPLAIRNTKKAVYSGVGLGIDEALNQERPLLEEVRYSADSKEGARAFTAREKPNFVGR